jgi:hypothetical protein
VGEVVQIALQDWGEGEEAGVDVRLSLLGGVVG